MKLITGDLSPYSAKVRMQLYAMGIEDVEFELPASFSWENCRLTRRLVEYLYWR